MQAEGVCAPRSEGLPMNKAPTLLFVEGVRQTAKSKPKPLHSMMAINCFPFREPPAFYRTLLTLPAGDGQDGPQLLRSPSTAGNISPTPVRKRQTGREWYKVAMAFQRIGRIVKCPERRSGRADHWRPSRWKPALMRSFRGGQGAVQGTERTGEVSLFERACSRIRLVTSTCPGRGTQV